MLSGALQTLRYGPVDQRAERRSEMADQMWVILVEGGGLTARQADGSVTLFLRDAVVLDERAVDGSWQVLLRTPGGVHRLRLALDDRSSIDRLKRLPRESLSDTEREAVLVRLATRDADELTPTPQVGSITFDGSFVTVVTADEEQSFLVGHVPLPTVIAAAPSDDGSLDVRLALPGRGEVSLVRVPAEGREMAERALLVCRSAVLSSSPISTTARAATPASPAVPGAASIRQVAAPEPSSATRRALVLAAIVEPLAWLGLGLCVLVGLAVAAETDGFGQRPNVGDGLAIMVLGSFNFLVVAMLAAYVQSRTDT